MDVSIRVRIPAIGLILCGFSGLMLRAQAPSTSSVTVSQSEQGVSATVSVSDPEDGPGRDGRGRNGRGPGGYHPSQVLVRFRSGTSFLPGSANARALSASENLHVEIGRASCRERV